MTLKEVKNMFEGQYSELYICRPFCCRRPNHFHTDNCNLVDEDTEYVPDTTKVGLFELMDEAELNNTIYANTCISADFADWYGDKEARVLCVMIDD